jgi:glutathione S-transferase
MTSLAARSVAASPLAASPLDCSGGVTLYRYHLSGHSHRVQLFLSLLDVPCRMVDIDLFKGEHRQADFVALNPLGQVPVLIDDGVVLADSNAILVYLASRYAPGSTWYPGDAITRGRIQRWLSVAAGPLVTGPALARRIRVYGLDQDPAAAVDAAHGLLAVLEDQLKAWPYLAGDAISIADIALYTYVAHATEGGVELDGYPAVVAWLRQVEALPGFVAMGSAGQAQSVATS